MSFVKMLQDSKTEVKPVTILNEELLEKIVEKADAVSILRKANYKIKMVTPTSFGTQIDLFKIYDEKEIQELLKGFTIKIKNKSIFIVD